MDKELKTLLGRIIEGNCYVSVGRSSRAPVEDARTTALKRMSESLLEQTKKVEELEEKVAQLEKQIANFKASDY